MLKNSKNLIYLLLIVTTLLTFSCGSEHSPIGEKPSQIKLATKSEILSGTVVAGSYIVAFKSADAFKRVEPDYFHEYQKGFLELRNVTYEESGVKNLRFLATIDLSSESSELGPDLQRIMFANSQYKEKTVNAHISEVNFHTNKKAKDLLNKWEKSGLIHYAEPNYQSKFSESFEVIKTTSTNPPYSNINLAAAFASIEEGGTSYAELAANGPVIAVLDSGVDYQHASLASKIYKPKVGAAGCEGDEFGCNTTQASLGVLGNGQVYPANVSGPGVECGLDKDGQKDSICIHGTHVSGIIAGVPDSSFTGICPFCRILPIRIVGKTKHGAGSDTTIADSSIIAGLKYIINFVSADSSAGIKVANMSFGKFQRSRTVGLLVSSLTKVNGGTLLVAASGNEDSIIRSYPAAFGSAVAVSSVDTDSNIKSYFSNFGKWVQISAYGNSIYSTAPGGGFESTGGTSQATPMVAGVAGLIVTKESGTISTSALRERLLSTANPSFYSEVSENKIYYQPADGSITNTPLLGYGIVDAEKAVKGDSVAQRVVIAGNDRVSAQGCGTISSLGFKRGFSLIFFLLLPTLLVASQTLVKTD